MRSLLLLCTSLVICAAVGQQAFIERFDKGWESRWVRSTDPKYTGQWEVERGIAPEGIDGDEGLVVQDKAKHHGIVHKFAKPFDNTGKDLVVQYEVRLQAGLDCGGAYIKLLTATPDGPSTINGDTPYTIMFGPDKCGSDSKLHFIFKHQSPVTGEVEEKHLMPRPNIKTDTLSHLYTLVVKADNSFEIFVDQESVKKGSLHTDFTPAVNPPTEIDDPTDSKPSDWVDEKEINDPEASKPEDWDESAPAQIVDPEDTKPAGWLDDAPSTVPDPNAEKPEDWDDDLDGEWDRPMIDNPACDEAGCGVWAPRKIKNPAYKGKWISPKIPNPAYKGEWKARQIPNPNYFNDEHPSNFKPVGAVGFEIWTMSDKILFDNIFVGHSEDEADEFAEKTWKVKYDAQKIVKDAEDEAARKVAEAANKKSWLDEYVQPIIESAQKHPERMVASFLGAILIPIVAYLAFGRGGRNVVDDDGKRAGRVSGIKKKTEDDVEVEEADITVPVVHHAPAATAPASTSAAAEDRSKSPRRSTRNINKKASTD